MAISRLQNSQLTAISPKSPQQPPTALNPLIHQAVLRPRMQEKVVSTISLSAPSSGASCKSEKTVSTSEPSNMIITNIATTGNPKSAIRKQHTK